MRGKQGRVWSQDYGNENEVGLFKSSCYPSPNLLRKDRDSSY